MIEFHSVAVLTAASTGIQLVAPVERDYVVGTQFHPEKSGEAGLEILSRFLAM